MTNSRTFKYTPEDLAKIVIGLEEVAPDTSNPQAREAIRTYATQLIGRGFSYQDEGNLMRTVASYFNEKQFGELTPDDVTRLGMFQANLNVLLRLRNRN